MGKKVIDKDLEIKNQIVEEAGKKQEEVLRTGEKPSPKEYFLEKKWRLVKDPAFITAPDDKKREALSKFYDVYGVEYLKQLGITDVNDLAKAKQLFIDKTFNESKSIVPKKKEETSFPGDSGSLLEFQRNIVPSDFKDFIYPNKRFQVKEVTLNDKGEVIEKPIKDTAVVPEIKLDIPQQKEKPLEGEIEDELKRFRPLPKWINDQLYHYIPPLAIINDYVTLKRYKKAKEEPLKPITELVDEVLNNEKFAYLKDNPHSYFALGEDIVYDINKYLKKDLKIDNYYHREDVINLLDRRIEDELIKKLRSSWRDDELVEVVRKAAEPFIKDAKPGTFLDPETGERKNIPDSDTAANYSALLTRAQQEKGKMAFELLKSDPLYQEKLELEKENEQLKKEFDVLALKKEKIDAIFKGLPAKKYLQELGETLKAKEEELEREREMLEASGEVITPEMIDAFNQKSKALQLEFEKYNKEVEDYNRLVENKGEEYQKLVEEFQNEYDRLTKLADEFDDKVAEFNKRVEQSYSNYINVPTVKQRLQEWTENAYLKMDYWTKQYELISRQIRGEEPAFTQAGLMAAWKQAANKAAEARAEFEAGARALFNNEGPADIEKDTKYLLEVFGRNFGRALMGKELDSFDKPTQQIVLQKLGKMAFDIGVNLTDVEKNNLKTSVAEIVYGTVGGLIPDMTLMMLANPIFHGLKIPTEGIRILRNPVLKESVVREVPRMITRVGKPVPEGWRLAEYFVGDAKSLAQLGYDLTGAKASTNIGLSRKLLLESLNPKVVEKSAKMVTSIKDPIPIGWEVLKEIHATPLQRASANIFNLIMGELVFSNVYGMSVGSYTGFELANLISPKKIGFSGRLQLLNPLIQGLSAGISPTIGVNAAKVTTTLGESLFTDKELSEEFKKIYPNVEESSKQVLGELISNTLFFGLMNGMTQAMIKQNTAPIGAKYNKFGKNYFGYFSPVYRDKVYKAAKEFEKQGYPETAEYLYRWLDITKEPISARNVKEMRLTFLEEMYKILPVGHLREMKNVYEDAIKLLEIQSRQKDFDGIVVLPLRNAKDLKIGNIISMEDKIKDSKTGKEISYPRHFEIVDRINVPGSDVLFMYVAKDVETGLVREFVEDFWLVGENIKERDKILESLGLTLSDPKPISELPPEVRIRINSPLEIPYILEGMYENVKVLNKVIRERGRYGEEYKKLKGQKPLPILPAAGGTVPPTFPKEEDVKDIQKKIEENKEDVEEIIEKGNLPPVEELKPEKETKRSTEEVLPEEIVVEEKPKKEYRYGDPLKFIEANTGDFANLIRQAQDEAVEKIRGYEEEIAKLKEEIEKNFVGRLTLEQRKKRDELKNKIAVLDKLAENEENKVQSELSEFLIEAYPDLTDYIKMQVPNAEEDLIQSILNQMWEALLNPTPEEIKMSIKELVNEVIELVTGVAPSVKETIGKEEPKVEKEVEPEIKKDEEKIEEAEKEQGEVKFDEEKEVNELINSLTEEQLKQSGVELKLTSEQVNRLDALVNKRFPVPNVHFPISIDNVNTFSEADFVSTHLSTVLDYIKRQINDINSNKKLTKEEKEKLLGKWEKIYDFSQARLEEWNNAVKEKFKETPEPKPPQFEELSEGAKMRAKGVNIVHGVKYYRQEPLKNIVVGESKLNTKVVFGEKLSKQIKHVIIEAKDLQPSHISGQINPRHFIPEAQPRNYGNLRVLADKARERAMNLDPEQLGPSPIAYTGAPVVNSRGEVIQGNGRAQTIKYYYDTTSNDPKGYIKYLKDIAEGVLGIDPNEIDKFNEPVYVRMLDVSDEEAIKLGNYTMSKDIEAVTEKTSEMKAAAGKLTFEQAVAVSNVIMRGNKVDDTLKDLIRKNFVQAMSLLTKYGIFNQGEAEKFMRNDEPTSEGIEAVSNVIKGIFFKGGHHDLPEIFEKIPYQLKMGIEKSIPILLSIPQNKSILPALRNVIVGLYEYHEFNLASEQKVPNINDWVNQMTMFDLPPSERYSEFELALIDKLYPMQKQKDIVNLFAKYYELVSGAPENLFEPAKKPLGREEATKQVFGIEYKPTIDDEYEKAIQTERVPESDNKGTDKGTEEKTEVPIRVETVEVQGKADEIRQNFELPKVVYDTLKSLIENLLEEKKLTNVNALMSEIARGFTFDEMKKLVPYLIQAISDLKKPDDYLNINRYQSDQALISLYKSLHLPVTEDKFTDIIGKLFYIPSTHRYFEVDHVEYWGSENDVKFPIMTGVMGVKADKHLPGEFAIVRLPYEGRNLLMAVEVKSLRDRISKEMVVHIPYYDNPEYSKRIEEIQSEYEALGMWEMVDSLEIIKKTKPISAPEDWKWEEEYKSIVNTLENVKKQENLYSGKILPEPIVMPDPFSVDDLLNGISQIGFSWENLGYYIGKELSREVLQKFVDFINELNRISAKLGFTWSEMSNFHFSTYLNPATLTRKYYDLFYEIGELTKKRELGDFEYKDKYKLAYYKNLLLDEILKIDDILNISRRQAFIWQLKHLIWRNKLSNYNKNKLRDLAEKYDVNEKNFGLRLDTVIRECVETALVSVSKSIAAGKGNLYSKFINIVNLYESLPTLTEITSEIKQLQQYSTPAPIGFLLGQFVNAEKVDYILEPSAGNGSLLISARRKAVRAIEIDPLRFENLRQQGYYVIKQDSNLGIKSNWFDVNKFDAILMNPPFSVEGVSGEVDGYKLSGEYYTVAKTLEMLAPHGKAAIITGANKPPKFMEFDEKGRMKGKDLIFFNWLASHYNIVDIIQVDGSLYGKMGTKYNIKIILINGRKKVVEGAAPLQNDSFKPVTDWQTLYDRISTQIFDANENAVLQSKMDAERSYGKVVGIGDAPRLPDKNRFRPSPFDEGEGAYADEEGGTKESDRFDGRLPGLGISQRGRGGTVPPDPSKPSIPTPTRVTHSASATLFSGGGFGVLPSIRNRGDLPATDIGRPAQRTFRDLVGKKEKLLAQRTGDEVTAYTPVSRVRSGNYVVPLSLVNEIQDAMKQLYEEVGDIDNYVMQKLNYNSIEQLEQFYFAEQVDSIAQIIFNIENDQAMIIGHQTGVGKGRIAAGIIRYARENGKLPVFFTRKADLFSDLWRDMIATGSGDYKPFIINKQMQDGSPMRIYNTDTGEVIYEVNVNELNKIIGKPEKHGTFELPEGTDVVLTTYSQFNSKKRDAAKMEFLMELARRNDVIFIMDESHTASGDSNTGEFFLKWLSMVKGGVYLSATYAKRPDNMPLYALKTVLTEANLAWEELVEAIERGGTALQEIISAQLAETGQFSKLGFRMDAETHYLIIGDTDPTQRLYGPEKAKELKDKFDLSTEILQEIIQFQKLYVNPVLQQMDEELKRQGSKVEGRQGTHEAGISNSPYFSRITNIIDELLFALKIKEIMPLVIEDAKKGLKPLVAFKNTMEAVLRDMLNNGEIEMGMEIKNDFSEVFIRGLKTVMKYTYKSPTGTSEKRVLDVSDLTQEGQIRYYEILNKIKDISTGIPLSPIDVIRKMSEQAGFSFVELTGRAIRLELSDDLSTGVIKTNDKPKKIEAIRKFNNNPGIIVAINAYGATGVSLHSSKMFDDKNQRVMYLVQNDFDINNVVQMLGRIYRADQVNKPIYNIVTSPIPAELRFFMMNAKKLKSLDANTSGNQNHSKSIIDVPDFLNKYGDQVVVEFLREDKAFNELINNPLGLDTPNENTVDAAYRVLKRVQILKVNEQEYFNREILQRYEQLIEYLNSCGQNDLLVTSEDLEAESKGSEVVVSGNGGFSAFGDDTVLHAMEVNVLRKPFTKKEVDELLKTVLQDMKPEDYSRRIKEQIIDGIDKKLNDRIVEINENYNKKVSETKERVMALKKMEEPEKLERLEHELENLKSVRDFRITAERDQAETIKGLVVRYTNFFYPGRVLYIPFTEDEQLDMVRLNKGVFVSFDLDLNKPNPYAPSSIFLRFATTDSRRMFRIPMSKGGHLGSIIANSITISQNEQNRTLEEWDKIRSNRQREIRYIVTGNILQGLGSGYKGRLMQFTMKDGTMNKGILLPETWIKPSTDKVRVPINRLANIIMALAPKDYIECVTGDVLIIKIQNNPYLFELRVPAATQRGSKFYDDEVIKSLMYENIFVKHGDRMVGRFGEDQLQPLLNYLHDKFRTIVEVKKRDIQKGENNSVSFSMMNEAPENVVDAKKIKYRGEISAPEDFEPLDSRKKDDSLRIGPDPIYNEKPKPVWVIFKEFLNVADQRYFKMRRPAAGRKAAGAYFPGTGKVGAKWIYDIRVFAHEMGHFLDDVYRLAQPMSQARLLYFRNELMELASFGSKPPKGVTGKEAEEYLLKEGVAEYLRAWILNPQLTEKRYPKFSEWFHERVGADEIMMDALNKLSREIRVWYGSKAIDRFQAHTIWGFNEEEAKLFKQTLSEKFKREIGGKFQFTPLDRFAFETLDVHHYWITAYRWLMKQHGIENTLDPLKLKPTENFEILLKSSFGFAIKEENILTKGLIDFGFNREYDPVSKDALSLGNLLKRLINGTMEEIDDEMRYCFAIGEAQRVIEIPWKLQARLIDAVLSDKNSIKCPPLDILKLHPYQYKKHKAKIDMILTMLENGKLKPEDVWDDATKYDFTNRKIIGLAQEFTPNDYEMAKKALEEFEELKQKDKAKYDRVNEFLRFYREMCQSVLRYIRDAGLISAESYEQIIEENLYYIMFSRVKSLEIGDFFDTIGKEAMSFTQFYERVIGVPMIKPVQEGLTEPVKLIKPIEGGTEPIFHPLISSLIFWLKMIQVADTNYLIQSFARALAPSRRFYEGTIDETLPDRVTGIPKIASIGWISDTWEPNSIQFFYKGRKKFMVIRSPELLNTFKEIHSNALSRLLLLEWLSFMPQVFRKSVITAIPFIVRNIQRDVRKFFTIGEGASYWRLVDLIPNRKMRDWFELSGAGMFGYFQKKPIVFENLLKLAIYENANEPFKIITHPWFAAKKFGNDISHWGLNSESLIRYKFAFKAAYRQAKEKYNLPDEEAIRYAMYHSRNLLDHYVKGRVMREFNRIGPFIAPAIAGLRQDIRAMRDNPWRTVMNLIIVEFIFGTMLTIANLLYLKHVAEDETEDEEKRRNAKLGLDEYDKMPWYKKALFFNFLLGEHGWLSIPRQYDIGLSMGIVEKILYAILIKEDKNLKGETLTVGERIASQFPFDKPFRGLNYISPIPEEPVTGYRGFKYLFGKSYYDRFRERFIIPPSEQELAIVRRNYESASPLAQKIQELTDILTPEAKNYLVDARQIDAFLQAQFTYYGKWAGQLSEYIDKGIKGEKVRPFYKFNILDFLGMHTYAPAYEAPEVRWWLDNVRKHKLDNLLPQESEVFNTLALAYQMALETGDIALIRERAYSLRNYAAILKEYASGLDLYKISDLQAYIEKVKKGIIKPNKKYFYE